MASTTTKQQARAFIDARPNVCYRTLERHLIDAYPDLSWQDERYADYLASVRPNCGYDCDDMCPVSKQAEP